MVRWLRWLAPLFLVACLVAFAPKRRPLEDPASATRLLMDTMVTVSLWAADPGVADFEPAFAAMQRVDEEMGRVPGSALWQLNETGGGSILPATAQVLEAAIAWSRRTRGAFDPTTAPLLDLWDVSSGPHPPPSAESLLAAREQVGWDKLQLDARDGVVDLGGAALDLGGIAKGYAIDQAAQALRDAGVESFIVNAGGDLFVAGSKGGKPWRVGIQHPRDASGFLRVVAPLTGALVTSGDYERGYQWRGTAVHHILDPRSGQPARGCQSVTVWAPTALDADALATAVFVLGPEEGMALIASQPAAEALLVDAAGRVHESPGFHSVAPEVGRR